MLQFKTSVVVLLVLMSTIAQAQERYPLNGAGDPYSGTSQPAARVASRDSLKAPALSVRSDGAEFFEASRILARVAGEPIFVGDLLGDANIQIERVAPGAPEFVKEKNRERMLSQLLILSIEQKLIYVDMMRKLPDPKVLPQLRKDVIDQFDKVQLPKMMAEMQVESRDELDAKLREFDSSLRNMREKWVDNQVIGIFVQQFVNEKDSITRQEMLDEYNAHKQDYYQAEQVRWEELMIQFDKAGGKEAAWKQITELGNEVIYGASLADLAKKHSHGYRASEGGQQDWTNRGSVIHKEIDQLLFELPVDYLSDRIETSKGYHIIRVLEHKQEGYVSFSDAQVEIKQRIENNRRKKRLGEYLSKLKSQIPVEIYDETAAAQYEQELAAAKANKKY
jgi:parvulin-like peptidyl-prolyl isomerase